MLKHETKRYKQDMPTSGSPRPISEGDSDFYPPSHLTRSCFLAPFLVILSSLLQRRDAVFIAKWKKSLSLALCLGCITCAHAKDDAKKKGYGTYLPSQVSGQKQVLSWYEEEAQTRLRQSQHNTDFYQMASFFAPQIHPTFCGVASSVIVLNTLRVPTGKAPGNPQLALTLPKVWGGATRSFPFYTQDTFFTDKTEQIKSSAVISLSNVTPENEHDASAFDPGLKLAELKQMLDL